MRQTTNEKKKKEINKKKPRAKKETTNLSKIRDDFLIFISVFCCCFLLRGVPKVVLPCAIICVCASKCMPHIMWSSVHASLKQTLHFY